MMAPAPMGAMVYNNQTQVVNNTTIINQAPPDEYTEAHGQSEEVIDREFRLMAGTKDPQNVWCIDCKEKVTSNYESEYTCTQKLCCLCFPCILCMDNYTIRKHMCPKCHHHLYLFDPGQSADELGFRQDDLPPGKR